MKVPSAPDIHREPHNIKQLNNLLADLNRELEPLYKDWDRLMAEMEAVLQSTRNLANSP